jgi:hypothetical protein
MRSVCGVAIFSAAAPLVCSYAAAAPLVRIHSAAAPSADAVRISTTNFPRSMLMLRHSIGLRLSKRAP